MILFCFTAGTFIPHASPSLQTGGGACEHLTAPFARPGVCTSASYRGGNRVGGREGTNGVGGGNRDGNRVGGGNGDVNGHGDGDGAGVGAGTGVEVNEGAQDGNGDGDGDGGWRPVDEHRMGTGTEARTVAEMGTGTRITGTGTRIGSGRADESPRSARNRKIIIDARWETGETRVERGKNVENKGLVQ